MNCQLLQRNVFDSQPADVWDLSAVPNLLSDTTQFLSRRRFFSRMICLKATSGLECLRLDCAQCY